MSAVARRSRGTAPREVIDRMQRAWGESVFYQARLRGPAPDRLLFQPHDPYSPDKNVAQAICRGRISLGDEEIDCDGDLDSLWNVARTGGVVDAFLQEFSWLRHLEALGSNGNVIAQQILKNWLDQFEKWSAHAWDPYFVSERLVQLCAHQQLAISNRDALWRSRVLSSMARQTRHLAHMAHRAETGFDRLMTALGLCVAGFCLPGCENQATRGIEMARRELRLQLRADGGHVSRNPSRQLKLAVRLQMVQSAIEARGIQPPGFLRNTVLRANAMAAFFRSADGRLAVFNGGYEDDAQAVLAVYNAINPDVAPISFARHSGYHKLTAGKAMVIADTGEDSGAQRYKSAGSFHFSSGRSRIIVNCGNGGHRASQWGKALAQSAAHSALSFEHRAQSVGPITHRRAENTRGQLLEMERALLIGGAEDALYRRRLYLSTGGGDLRGEEYFHHAPRAAIASAVWRFHLHPSVRVSLARDKKSAILMLPNKEGWRFKSNAPVLSLERSVYCGEGGAAAATEQLVIRAASFAAEETGQFSVKWALRRHDAV